MENEKKNRKNMNVCEYTCGGKRGIVVIRNDHQLHQYVNV